MQGGNLVCRRSALERVGSFDTTIPFYGEDTDIARRLHSVGRAKFTFRLPIYASGKRLAAEGLITTGARYALNYFSVLIVGRPVTRVSTDVRPPLREPGGAPPADESP